jgi:hypothetical protein
VLCIPATSTGVERVFSCARDFCNYRRGKTSRETLSAQVLLEFERRHKARTLVLRDRLTDSISVASMTDEDIMFELAQRKAEIQRVVQSQYEADVSQYIPMRDAKPGAKEDQFRWAQNKARRIDKYEKKVKAHSRTQGAQGGMLSLSSHDRHYTVWLRQVAEAKYAWDRAHPEIYDVPVSDDDDEPVILTSPTRAARRVQAIRQAKTAAKQRESQPDIRSSPESPQQGERAPPTSTATHDMSSDSGSEYGGASDDQAFDELATRVATPLKSPSKNKRTYGGGASISNKKHCI